jgi:hypothetical protein
MPEVMTFGECMAALYPPDPVTIDDAALLKLGYRWCRGELCYCFGAIRRVGTLPFTGRQ